MLDNYPDVLSFRHVMEITHVGRNLTDLNRPISLGLSALLHQIKQRLNYHFFVKGNMPHHHQEHLHLHHRKKHNQHYYQNHHFLDKHLLL